MGESRAYRLKEDEPLPDGIARVARGRIDHAIDELRGKTDSTPVEAVHEARKDMKKLRALLRLARGELGRQTYDRENACFRDAARELAGQRDADVMLETLDRLTYLPAGQAWELRKRIQADLERNGGEGDRDGGRAERHRDPEGGARPREPLAARARLVRRAREGAREDLPARPARVRGGDGASRPSSRCTSGASA